MGRWGDKPRSEKSAAVAVDTLVLPTPARAFCVHVDAAPGTTVTLIAVTHWKEGESNALPADCGPVLTAQAAGEGRPAWGKVLPVPERSQFAEEQDAAAICSPTSVAMVLEFHGFQKSTREVADGVYDHAARIYGNWPFNTAYAHRVSGLETLVRRGTSWGCLEAEIAAGRPAIISHKWRAGELDGAPLPQSDGHLIVVAGFTQDGDVVANDPAGRPDAVRRVYKRRQIYRTWLERGSGIMYLLKIAN